MTDEERKWLDNAQRYGGGFVKSFADTCFRADDQNFELLRKPLGEFMKKYPKYSEEFTRHGPGHYTAAKFFSVYEESLEGGWYRVTVRSERGEEVQVFEAPAMKEAQDKFLAEGYRYFHG